MLRTRLLAAAAALCVPLCACSGGAEDPPAPAAAAAAPAPAARSADPRIVRLREAIEDGRLDLARTLFAQVGSLSGAEEPLLRARIALLAGDATAALRAVEEARHAAPEDAVRACAAEIYANLGRFEAAAREIEAGVAAVGRTAELERAAGVALILQPGGATQGLERLERARELDPALPFADRALSQAALLEGRRLLSAGDVDGALERARQARRHDPDEPDAIELEADCLQVANDFDGALALQEELEALGEDTRAVRADLHQRAATFALFRRDRAGAVAHYEEARALGLDDAGLGFGATVLAEEAGAAVARGVEAYAAGDLAAARTAFERALALDPRHLAARNHLGVLAFRERDYAAAAEAWSTVLEDARAAGVALPEPVELNLARALKLAGREEDAAAVVEGYLADAPDSPWGAEAREILERLGR